MPVTTHLENTFTRIAEWTVPKARRSLGTDLYWELIGFFANQMDVAVEDLTLVVLAHEQAHAYTHRGHDANGCAWDLDSFDKSDPGLVEGLTPPVLYGKDRRVSP